MDNSVILCGLIVDNLWISQKVSGFVDNLWISQKVIHKLSTGSCQWSQGFKRVIHLSTAPTTSTTVYNIYIVISTINRIVDNFGIQKRLSRIKELLTIIKELLTIYEKVINNFQRITRFKNLRTTPRKVINLMLHLSNKCY